MARTAILIIFALLILFLLPLSSSVNTQSRLSATNSTAPPKLVWLDSTVGIVPAPADKEGQEDTPAPRPSEKPVMETALPGRQVASGAGASPRGWEAARRKLDALGIRQFRLETWGHPPQFRFTCWVPLKGNPFITRQFQASAADELEAVWQVLGEVEHWLGSAAEAAPGSENH